jgi:hypothetical protein
MLNMIITNESQLNHYLVNVLLMLFIWIPSVSSHKLKQNRAIPDKQYRYVHFTEEKRGWQRHEYWLRKTTNLFIVTLEIYPDWLI